MNLLAAIPGVDVPAWELVKQRTAAVGEVWRSPSGDLFRKTGDESLREEVSFQRSLFNQGFPVPEIVDAGEVDGVHFLVERSVGANSLHDLALRDYSEVGAVRNETIDAAIATSTALLNAQVQNTSMPAPGDLEVWLQKAAFLDNVLQENPDFDNDRVQAAINIALERLSNTRFCLGHLDYGFPNAFPAGIIDWQHHAEAPIGFDVYPMLDIAAFKGGNRGYAFTRFQRDRYISGLDKVTVKLAGKPLSVYLGDFLFVKSFFFLALMKPNHHSKPSKHQKWQYRRKLFLLSLEQYESTYAIDTSTFPKFKIP